jgi:FtsP/CotA-like multicopper oxidase with cupredoxin domain
VSSQTPKHFSTEVEGLPEAQTTEIVELADGERFDLRVAPVAKRLGNETVRMLAYSGSIPGPTLRVPEGSEVEIDIENQLDLKQTVHWHGLRLENRYDGTHETQQPIETGQIFTARVAFPDPGLYWYHPHIREDYAQEMGLYGNVIVDPRDPNYWPPCHHELVLALDDVLIENGAIARFDTDETTYVAMGRFGNTLLVNGETDLKLSVRRGEVVRLYLTNTANTRVFRVGVPGARMKLIGGDSGRVEREEYIEEVILAPSERAIVDVLFDQPGPVHLGHRTPEKTHQLAGIEVKDEPAEPNFVEAFEELRANEEMTTQRRRVEHLLGVEPDKVLAFLAEMEMGGAEDEEGSYVCPMHPEVVSERPDHCPKCGMKLMPSAVVEGAAGGHESHDHGGSTSEGIEWEDDMVEMNRMTTPANMRWKLVDRPTGAENQEIEWKFRVGDQVKIRLQNEMAGDHPMHHPFHVHGAGRFLVLSRDGTPEPNLVWKDTVLVRTGETVDILLDVTSPGRWMAHCHIAEHHESGMMFSFDVTED